MQQNHLEYSELLNLVGSMLIFVTKVNCTSSGLKLYTEISGSYLTSTFLNFIVCKMRIINHSDHWFNVKIG